MSEATAPVTTETAPQTTQEAPATQAPATTPQAAPQAREGLSSPSSEAPKPSGLDFIPESYRNSSWAQKYKTQEDFFKGVDGMAQMIGKKQIVQGVERPADDAPEEAWDKFYADLGRPEALDKYALPEDVQGPEGFDLDGEKKLFTELAHSANLSNKQATKLFKNYMNKVNENFKTSEENRNTSFNEVVKQTFPQDTQTNLALAKKGAKALGLVDTLTEKGLDLHPEVLRLCAKLGELSGEDSFVKGGEPDSKESLLEEAKRIQASPEYLAGDKKAYAQVEGIYKKVYDKK